MTGKEYYDMLLEHRQAANGYAREILMEARVRKIDVPTLVSSLVNEYACERESAAMRDMERYL